MKNLAILLTMMLLTLGATQAQAKSSETIDYSGQEYDSLSFELIDSLTRYRSEQINSTCTRDIPYQAQECGNETRYRQECHYEAGRNECRTEYERTCRTVRRTRRECTPARGGNNRNCRVIPAHEVCRAGSCRTVPERRVCNGGQPSQPVCRDVPYTEQECTNTPRQRCNRIPGRNVCRDVPYSEYICRNVTRYRSETYACVRTIQVPYQFDKKLSADIDVNYKGQTANAESQLSFELTKSGDIQVYAQDHSQNEKLISVKKLLDIDNQEDESYTKGKINIRFFNKKALLRPVTTQVSAVDLQEKAIHFQTGLIKFPAKTKLNVKIVRDGFFSSAKTLFDKELTLDDVLSHQDGNKTQISIDLGKYGVELENKKHEVTISIELQNLNEILNLGSDRLERSDYFEIKVK